MMKGDVQVNHYSSNHNHMESKLLLGRNEEELSGGLGYRAICFLPRIWRPLQQMRDREIAAQTSRMKEITQKSGGQETTPSVG